MALRAPGDFDPALSVRDLSGNDAIPLLVLIEPADEFTDAVPELRDVVRPALPSAMQEEHERNLAPVFRNLLRNAIAQHLAASTLERLRHGPGLRLRIEIHTMRGNRRN